MEALTDSVGWRSMLEVSARFRRYSFNNQLLIWAQATQRGATLTRVAAFGTWRALNGSSEAGVFIGAAILFTLSYIGIAISLWPMIVPYHYTLWEAASSPKTQAFLLVGTLFLLPVILVYTGWSYWVFRGKVRADIGYHH